MYIFAQEITSNTSAAPATTASTTQPDSTAPAADPASQKGFGSMGGILIWVLLFVGLYFIMILPTRKRQKALAKLQSELKMGDSVVTTSGIIGKIVSIEDSKVLLQVSEGTRISFLRPHIVGLYNDATESK